MKKWMIVTAGTMCMITGYPSFAQRNTVTCTGILIEVDMNPRADFRWP